MFKKQAPISYQFKGGVHPPDKKDLSKDKPIVPANSPSQVIIPLVQHIGAPAQTCVAVGQEVKKGEVVGKAGGFVSAPVHSSVSGKVSAISEIPHPVGRMVPAVVIDNNSKEEWIALKETTDYNSLTDKELKDKIWGAGIVGMGGATFPTHVKLSPPKEKTIDAVIINGVECEPYLTSDYRLMLEHPKEILEGLKILMKALNVKKGYIGIEKNKPEAIRIMQKIVGFNSSISVHELEVKYPQGAEKMLIKAILNREVPPRALPMDVGVVVQNVGTAAAAYEAVCFGKPLIERVVTVTGEGINEPKNILTKIGTKTSELIEMCGGVKSDAVKIISGGPMMGFAIYTTDIPVSKGTSGILVLEDRDTNNEFGPCIKCGRCMNVCPMGLMPFMLGILSEKECYEEAAKEYNAHDCFECGSCTYICPSKRPMVHFIKLIKSLVKP